MEIHEILDDKILKANYDYWLSKWNPLIEPSEHLKKVLASIPTTHTFGMEESMRRKPYMDILFSQKALLSQNSRTTTGLYYKDEEKMKLGEGYILSDFVFAFLGIHDHFFSTNKEKKIPTPAFGAFLPQKLDTHQFSNASRTDLSSINSTSSKEKEFFNPDDARKYCSYKIANEHSSNFDDYWGDYRNFKNNPAYKSESWMWQIEFHYYNRVDCSNFSAILWPVQKILVSSTQRYAIDPDRLLEIKKFKKENKNVLVYVYEWKALLPPLYFSIGSYIVSNYFYENIKLISTEDFKINFIKFRS